MELLNLPFTGPTSLLYDPPKELMKYVAYTEGINTPAYALIPLTVCMWLVYLKKHDQIRPPA